MSKKNNKTAFKHQKSKDKKIIEWLTLLTAIMTLVFSFSSFKKLVILNLRDISQINQKSK